MLPERSPPVRGQRPRPPSCGHLADDPDRNLIARSDRDHPPAREVVKVGVDTGHLHLFGAGSGLRVGELARPRYCGSTSGFPVRAW
jgi:hypothetical protein